MPIIIHFRSLFVFLKSHLLKLNLFESGIQDARIIKQELRSTRFYLILLIASMIIVTFYCSVTTYIETVLIKSPSFIQYSTHSQKVSLQCPCSIIAIKYEQFVEIKPIYHEFCQSNFVSDKWINHLYDLYEQSWNNSISSDFRRTAVFQFQTLRSLCQLVQDTIENSLKIFQQTDYIHSYLVSQELFQDQISSFITEFIDLTPKTFSRTLNFVQNITAQSLLMTGASLTSILPSNDDILRDDMKIPYPGMVYTFADNSTCTCSSSTATSCMGLAIFNNYIVPNFQTGCYMLNALLKSTLEAFFNQTFLDMLTNSTETFQKLNSSVSNKTIETLLRQMFVTHWSNKTIYERYFNQCAPDLCHYTIDQHYDFLHIVTLLIGLGGGLSSAMKIIAPFIIVTIWPFIWKFVVQRRARRVQSSTASSIRNRIKSLLNSLKRTMIELNLFKSVPPSQDENILREQRLTTRIYLILFLTALISLSIFTIIKPQLINITVKSPSLEDFIKLYDQYPLSLKCPCSQTTINYNEFISYIKPQYHEICLSKFVTPSWINIQYLQDVFKVNTYDFRSQSEYHFQLLSTLCHMANQTIEESLQSFFQTKFVSIEVVSYESFHIEINSIIEQLKITVVELFSRTLQLIQTNLEINRFITSMNSLFRIREDNNGEFNIDVQPFRGCFLRRRHNKQFDNDDCNSFLIEKHYRLTRIKHNKTNYIISGMFQTWFPLQSLLKSSLECFYNDSCLSQIIQFINSNVSSTNFSTLKTTNQYDSIEFLANHLFIEYWINESSFQSYFNQCHPLTCQYNYYSQLNLIYIATTFIALFGGLDVVLQLLAPFIVKFIPKICNFITCRRRIQTVTKTEMPSKRLSKKIVFRNHLWSWFIFIKRTLIELNLFSTVPPSQDRKILRRNRHTTRVYLILLITVFFILVLYLSLKQDTIINTIESPSISTYTDLFNQYPLTLHCPCKNLTVKYDRLFSQIKPQYHQICSSVFISPTWFENLSLPSYVMLHEDDFRVYISFHFYTMSKLCNLTEKALNLSLEIFQQTDFITPRVISRVQFNIQTEALIEQFKRTTSNQFMEIFKLIQVTNHANQLATLFLSNWRFILKYPDTTLDYMDKLEVLTQPRIYDEQNSSCGLLWNSSKLSSFPYRTSNQSLRQTLPGFRIGCLPLDSLLQSSFTCLYNRTCLDIMHATIYYFKHDPVDTFTYSPLSPPNTTIETILNRLFVSDWFQKTSFDRYFNACTPHVCQYSYTTNMNIINIITKVIAVFGGFIEGLHFTILCISLLIFKFIDHHKNRKQTESYRQPSNNVINKQDHNTIEVLSNPTITTVQPIVRKQSKLWRRSIYRAILVCFILLVIAAIIAISFIWLTRENNDHQFISTNTTTTLTTISITIESTMTLTSTCYMTLQYQSQVYPTGHGPKSIVTGDFNRDSILDLAVTNYDDDTMSVMLGNRNGTFQSQQVYSTGHGSRPWGVTTGDFNNDTLLDLAITLSVPNAIAIFFGTDANMTFVTSPHQLLFDGFDNVIGPIEVGDLNGDGLIDLVVGGNIDDMLTSLLLCFNLGDGYQFDINSVFESPKPFTSIVIGNFDNDGRENDISMCDTTGLLITLFPIDDRNMRYRDTINTMYGQSLSLVKGRFNDDELDDLAVISPQSDTLEILFANGDRTFIRQMYHTISNPTSVARINFNNDLIDDVAVLSCNRTIIIFLGSKIGLFDQNYLSFDINEKINGKCAESLTVADFNQDEKDDLIFTDTETSDIKVLLSFLRN